MERKKKIILFCILLCVVIGGYYSKRFIDLRTYRKQVSNITISNVDLSNIPDGIYAGSYEIIWVAVDVEVVVKNNSINSIVLKEHKHGKGEAAEVILEKVIEAQSLEVDIVSGATSSSKVILKAIENALTKN
ncbi:FMN-binding protein [Alkaliphilus peptidifermentans]|uniref:Uncharacterized protein, contains FMN-binding domain n=1 Tax=Alkaliphilus peptidifermentans DSM 18978 TaxID=1120976 RepID=A0A1G5KKL0_9FIRM|nr:FMN-binding protein [Alkaliphilus peptidifermentans]SCZ00904.1 Uncharacterized protein, contains FMN-binding domain [Alkaliphilus peptidifermentans DSM 18978]